MSPSRLKFTKAFYPVKRKHNWAPEGISIFIKGRLCEKLSLFQYQTIASFIPCPCTDKKERFLNLVVVIVAVHNIKTYMCSLVAIKTIIDLILNLMSFIYESKFQQLNCYMLILMIVSFYCTLVPNVDAPANHCFLNKFITLRQWKESLSICPRWKSTIKSTSPHKR